MEEHFLPTAIMLSSHRGWVMEATAKESARAIFHRPVYIYIPSSRRALFDLRLLKSFVRSDLSNSVIFGYDTYLRLLKFWKIDENTCNLYFTHQNYSIEPKILNGFSKILVMNSSSKLNLVSAGVIESKIHIVYGAIDEEKFTPSIENSQIDTKLPSTYVLISSDCKARKNPEKILDLIEYMSDVKFVIHGKDWKVNFDKRISELSNLKYFEFNFEAQPYFMKHASTFLSLSVLEGGPYSLLEALVSGTPVVASRTGFVEDFIDSSNGVIVEHNSDIEDIASIIQNVLAMKRQTRGRRLTLKDLSWRRLGADLYGRTQ